MMAERHVHESGRYTIFDLYACTQCLLCILYTCVRRINYVCIMVLGDNRATRPSMSIRMGGRGYGNKSISVTDDG